jgi:hypothetical protein
MQLELKQERQNYTPHETDEVTIIGESVGRLIITERHGIITLKLLSGECFLIKHVHRDEILVQSERY